MGFLDQRQWMASLEQQGELRRIKAEVDWDREIGAIARRMLEKKGPALLFENIKGYTNGRCQQAVRQRARRPLATGAGAGLFPRCLQPRAGSARHEDEPRDDSAGCCRHRPGQGSHRPRRCDRSDRISSAEMALPRGRPLHPHVHVDRDPRSRHRRHERRHVSRYDRSKKNTTPFLLIKGGQHWGAHFVKWAARGQPMPVACVIGWDPIMSFLAGSPSPAGVCEWDVMGGYRGEAGAARTLRDRRPRSPGRAPRS